MKIYKYETDQERADIIANEQSSGYVMVAVSNVKDGKFLGFLSEAAVSASRLVTSQHIISRLEAIEAEVASIKQDTTKIKTDVIEIKTFEAEKQI